MSNHRRMMDAAVAALGLFLAAGAAARAEGLQFGISGGIAKVDLSKSEFDDAAETVSPLAQSSLDDTGSAWGLQIGYRWSSYFAAELGYSNLGRADYEADLAGVPAQVTVRFQSSGLTLSALGMFPIGEQFDVHGRAGIYFANTRVRVREEDFSTGLVISEEFEDRSKDLFAGVGATWNINEGYSLRFEYQRLLNVGDNETGEEDIDLLTFGVLFR